MSQAKVKSKKLGVKSLYQALDGELNAAKEAKTYKYEIPIDGKQGGVVQAAGKRQVMLASNNYLGLANHPRILQAAQKGLQSHGYGLASVRFICGTQKIHLELEERIARFLGTEAAILHGSCFAANEAFFTALLSAELGASDYRDVIYSDKLNHASIIDGVRLSRIAAKTTDARAYKHNDIDELKRFIDEDQDKDYRIATIVTDGVFSMEGEFADLKAFVELAKQKDALLFVDESHSTGVLGKTGRGTPEHCGVHGQIDVISGTLGKALAALVVALSLAKKCWSIFSDKNRDLIPSLTQYHRLLSWPVLRHSISWKKTIHWWKNYTRILTISAAKCSASALLSCLVCILSCQ
jgi:glycine C-acetyltransferase